MNRSRRQSSVPTDYSRFLEQTPQKPSQKEKAISVDSPVDKRKRKVADDVKADAENVDPQDHKEEKSLKRLKKGSAVAKPKPTIEVEEESPSDMVVEVPAKSSKKVESSKGKKKEVEAMEETEEAVVKKDVAKASKRTTENVPAKQSTVSFEEFQQLQKKYEELKQLRLTEPEKLVEEMKKTQTNAEMASQRMVDHLKQEKEKLSRELKEVKAHAQPAPFTNAEMSSLQSKVANLQEALKLAEAESKKAVEIADVLQKVTSSRVTPMGEGKFNVEYSGAEQRVAKYVLIFESDEIELVPMNKEATKDFLPSYLRENICFPEDQLPRFTVKLMSALHKKAEKKEEDAQ